MKITIVGGGIVGVTAAILLQKNNHQVTIIEKANKLGGLLNSIQMTDGTFVDFGSHVPRETGIESLDKVLFGGVSHDLWNTYSYANVGNYFQNQLNSESQFIDMRNLQPEDYIKGLNDLLNVESIAEILNENESLNVQFGETFANKVYRPLLNKLFGENDLEKLLPNSHNLFGYSRLIVADQNMTEIFKTMDYLDDRIAHTKNSIGFSTKRNFYPKRSGIYQWVQSLEKQAIELGVNIITNQSIVTVNKDHLKLQNEMDINYDKLIWTLPKVFLENMIGGSRKQENIKFRGVHLFHFKYNGELKTKNHYIYCNNSKMKTFRVTLYENLTASSTKWCTVEVIGEKNASEVEIFKELVKMQILAEGSSYILSSEQYIANGFPIPLISTHSSVELKTDSNTILMNKDANNFFMEDLLIKMYNRLLAENLI